MLLPFPPVIGLYSPAMGSGKTTLARHIVEHYNYQLVSSANVLKSMIAALLEGLGLDPHEVWECVHGRHKETPLEELRGVTTRRLMQTLGTEWGRRVIYEDLWVDLTAAKIRRLLAQGQRVILDDIRFPNEWAMVRSFHGWMVEVYRPDAAVTETHASEGALSHLTPQGRILNDGTLAALWSRADRFMSRFHDLKPI